MLYKCYGFPIRSEFELPELQELPVDTILDSPPVEILQAPVQPELSGGKRLGPRVAYTTRAALYDIPDVGRFLIEDGLRITVDLLPSTRAIEARVYLLGTGLGTIMHQRGLIPLHISAVLSPVGAFAFTGPSGAGKSTLAARLNAELGWPIITDDVAAMRITADGNVEIEGGVYRSRLWRDALERLDIQTEDLERDLHRQEKYQIVRPDLFVAGPQRLISVTELVPDGGIGWRLLSGAEGFSCLMRTVYKPLLLRLFQKEEPTVASVSKACKTISISKTDIYKMEKTTFLVEKLFS